MAKILRSETLVLRHGGNTFKCFGGKNRVEGATMKDSYCGEDHWSAQKRHLEISLCIFSLIPMMLAIKIFACLISTKNSYTSALKVAM